MSVINQLLLDLEKRRVSGAERNILPGHVRALPDGERTIHWGWIAAGGAAAVLAALWALFSGFDWTIQRTAATNTQRTTEVVIEKVVAASAGLTLDARPGDDSNGAPMPPLASRLSFELSVPPAPVERPASHAPLPTARVIGRAAPESATRSESPAVPTERIDPLKPPDMAASAKVPAERAEPSKPPAAVATAKVPAGKPEIQREVRQPTQRDLAENEYRKATASLHQGRLAEAQEGYQAALNLFPGHHDARQALVGLLLDTKKLDEAERVLQEGLTLSPSQSGFAMTLARLQVDRGETAQASATLKKGLENAPLNADYLAFLAALLQRQGRHEEAIEQFQGALRLRPAAGVWWLGLGISLQAANRISEARDAFSRAHASNNLNPELASFAEQRLKQLQ
jgi:MSHA biogenesis protein MshN